MDIIIKDIEHIREAAREFMPVRPPLSRLSAKS